ncbi:hypothetical protein E2C01_093773 [Portunus trituberculatus]|uniref:Uncharacterized protein n=1 Tax=Portunus trituberculatus TaxID=210409 RepID=A0A5B7K1A0_PORTR|nr:hypothetical protein [Portunus trituberculatus]
MINRSCKNSENDNFFNIRGNDPRETDLQPHWGHEWTRRKRNHQARQAATAHHTGHQAGGSLHQEHQHDYNEERTSCCETLTSAITIITFISSKTW